MDPNVLAPWRDLAIVWLGLLTILFVAVPGVVFYFGVRGIRAAKRWLRPKLLLAQVWAKRIQNGAARASARVAALPIALSSAGARMSATARRVLAFK